MMGGSGVNYYSKTAGAEEVKPLDTYKTDAQQEAEELQPLQQISERTENVSTLRENMERQAKRRKRAMIGTGIVGALVTAGAGIGTTMTAISRAPVAIPIILGVVGGLAALLSIVRVCRLHAKRRGDIETVNKCDIVLNKSVSKKEQATAARELLQELSQGGEYDVTAATDEAANNDSNVADAMNNMTKAGAEVLEGDPAAQNSKVVPLDTSVPPS